MIEEKSVANEGQSITLTYTNETLTFTLETKSLNNIKKKHKELSKILEEGTKEFEIISPIYVKHILDEDSQEKASEMKAQLDSLKKQNALLVDDIAALMNFDREFRKNLDKKIKEEAKNKAKKEEQELMEKFKEDFNKNPDVLSTLFLKKKKENKNMNYVKFVALIKRALDNETSEKSI